MILNVTTPTNQVGIVIKTCTPDESKWITIQQRVDGSVSFMRSWQEYVEGFGFENGNYWAGLEFMNNLTKFVPKRLRILLEHFDGSVPDVVFYWNFSVMNAESNYRLNISGFSGNIGNSLKKSNRMMFTTQDTDNDRKDSENCAVKHKCSWWMNSCFYACLNGEYQTKANTELHGKGIVWLHPRKLGYSYKRSIMSIT